MENKHYIEIKFDIWDFEQKKFKNLDKTFNRLLEKKNAFNFISIEKTSHNLEARIKITPKLGHEKIIQADILDSGWISLLKRRSRQYLSTDPEIQISIPND